MQYVILPLKGPVLTSDNKFLGVVSCDVTNPSIHQVITLVPAYTDFIRDPEVDSNSIKNDDKIIFKCSLISQEMKFVYSLFGKGD